MKTVFIALGTNLGDRLANLRNAIDSLLPEIRVIRKSTVYETPPWGFTDQPAFLNMVISAETSLAPHALLDFLKEKESVLGRVKNFRNGPRQIDLDILFYESLILDEKNLTIPHPHLHERGFVLVPLAEIAPQLAHPLLKKNITELLQDVDAREIIPFSV